MFALVAEGSARPKTSDNVQGFVEFLREGLVVSIFSEPFIVTAFFGAQPHAECQAPL